VARSGVHASAIYRRWPSRIELIEEAVFPGLSPLSVQPTRGPASCSSVPC
jgi:AcrR family transcriptional regulator